MCSQITGVILRGLHCDADDETGLVATAKKVCHPNEDSGIQTNSAIRVKLNQLAMATERGRIYAWCRQPGGPRDRAVSAHVLPSKVRGTQALRQRVPELRVGHEQTCVQQGLELALL